MSGKELNHLFSLAAGFVNQTTQHLFITGKAGTGKTTFLKYIRENSFKKIAVVAPTGVAAINAGGVTMHSFFQLPIGLYLPTKQPVVSDLNIEIATEHTLLKNIRFSSTKRELLRELELLVIDEVSMVRADMLDAVDAILRYYRRQPLLPFGGVQMLYIGDLFQLPPVANREEWNLLKDHYKSPFFFDALVMEQTRPVYIELKKIYRQTDETFISILNNIRNNACTKKDLESLHQHYQPGFRPPKEESFITLTSHNAKADAINKAELNKLPGKLHSFEGTVKGDFSEKSYPVDKVMYLKEGAQIMFIKNDKGEVRRFYNGKIGTVKRMEGDKVFAVFPGEADELEIEKETWKNIRYNYDKEKDTIDEDELGSYTQFPIRLAWAITIHKSQGLTFEKAIIDAGSSFAAGQVYVALSRLTSMNGLVLYSRIMPGCISTDERVLHFAKEEMNEEELRTRLGEEQKKFVSQSIIETFNWSKLTDTLAAHLAQYEHRQIGNQNKAVDWAQTLVDKAIAQKEIAKKFTLQLGRLLQEAEGGDYTMLHQRTKAAADYFTKVIEELMESVRQHREEWKNKSKVKKYLHDLDVLGTVLKRKALQMQHAVHITTGLTEGLDAMALLQIVEEQRKNVLPVSNTQEAGVPKDDKNKAPKGQTKFITLQLYRQGKSIEDIAVERGFSPITIEGHLAACVEIGEIDVKELVPEEKIDPILKAIALTDGVALAPVKEKLSDDFSYAEIKAVMGYRQFLQHKEGTEA